MDAVLAQRLSTRASRALNRVCLGQARRVRIRRRSRVIGSLENKRNDTGLRFVLQPPKEGNAGYLLWQDDRLPALIDWEDPVVRYGLRHPIKYARLIVRQAPSARAQGSDRAGQRYFVQLALEGVPYQKPKHPVGSDTVGLDLGSSTIAIVPRQGTPRLELLCSELAPDAQAIRRLQRQMVRQRRANNPDNFDAKGRIKKGAKQRLQWKQSKRYLATRRRNATRERRLAAHRKSLHGRLVHEIVAVGKTVITEHVSYRAWQKQFGRSVGLRAPGMFMELLRRDLRRVRAVPMNRHVNARVRGRWCLAASRMPRVGAHRPKSPSHPLQEPASLLWQWIAETEPERLERARASRAERPQWFPFAIAWRSSRAFWAGSESLVHKPQSASAEAAYFSLPGARAIG
jgi:hypothetical protein